MARTFRGLRPVSHVVARTAHVFGSSLTLDRTTGPSLRELVLEVEVEVERELRVMVSILWLIRSDTSIARYTGRMFVSRDDLCRRWSSRRSSRRSAVYDRGIYLSTRCISHEECLNTFEDLKEVLEV
jgi:hypothetical protein